MRLAVLASGQGTLLEAALKQNVPVHLVVADRPCRALEIAKEHGIPNFLMERSFGKNFNREDYTEGMVVKLREHSIDRVAMMGFLTIFSASMFAEGAYQLKIFNTHPSLLPSFKGDHAVADALAYGVKISGCTIHIAIPELDAGPILAQESVKVFSWDTVESLHERIKEVERVLYPVFLKTLLFS